MSSTFLPYPSAEDLDAVSKRHTITSPVHERTSVADLDVDLTSREPPPKRRRLDTDSHNSPAYSSADELAPSSNSSSPHLRPLNNRRRSIDVATGSTPMDEVRDSQEESPDELDHFSYHPTKSSSSYNQHIRHPASNPSISAHDSPAVDIPSSPVQHDDEVVERLPNAPPKLHYKPKLILRGHKRAVCAVKFSPDGQWIASCSADATIKIWDALTGAHYTTLTGHLSGVNTISWSPDSHTLASGSDDKSIRLWDISTCKAYPRALLGHHNYVFCLAFSPAGNMLVSGSHDEAVNLWDVRTARLMRSLPAHSDPVSGVDFNRDGTLIASCSSDGLIRVWDTATGQCLRTFFHEDTPPVASVRFSPNGRFVLTWMLDSSLRMWNYGEGRCVKTYQGHRNERFGLSGAFGLYGGEECKKALVVSGSENGDVLVWDVVSKGILQRLTGHEGAVLGVDVHSDLKAMVSCGMDRTIRIWREEHIMKDKA